MFYFERFQLNTHTQLSKLHKAISECVGVPQQLEQRPTFQVLLLHLLLFLLSSVINNFSGQTIKVCLISLSLTEVSKLVQPGMSGIVGCQCLALLCCLFSYFPAILCQMLVLQMQAPPCSARPVSAGQQTVTDRDKQT